MLAAWGWPSCPSGRSSTTCCCPKPHTTCQPLHKFSTKNKVCSKNTCVVSQVSIPSTKLNNLCYDPLYSEPFLFSEIRFITTLSGERSGSPSNLFQFVVKYRNWQTLLHYGTSLFSDNTVSLDVPIDTAIVNCPVISPITLLRSVAILTEWRPFWSLPTAYWLTFASDISWKLG